MNRLPVLVASFLVGLVFGLGLILSGLANPAKVLAFLDLAGAWDPSLMLVMGGAVVVAMPFLALARRRHSSWLGLPLHLPARRPVEGRLVVGSLAFGVGWGLVGFCPGPAVVALGMLNAKAAVFVAAMLGGMALFECWERWLRRRATGGQLAREPQ